MSRLNKKNISIFMAMVLTVTALGADQMFVTAETSEVPTIVVNEDTDASEVTAQEASLTTEDLVTELDGMIKPQSETLIAELTGAGSGQLITDLDGQLGFSVVLKSKKKGQNDYEVINADPSDNEITIADDDRESSFSLTLSMNLLQGVGSYGNLGYTDIDNRTISEGDYFEFSLPDAFKVSQKVTGNLKFNGNIIATYSVETNGKVKITFTDVVNKEKDNWDISAWFSMEFSLDQDKLEIDNKTDASLTIGDYSYTFHLPAKPDNTKVSGINKTIISYNETTREISWNIAAGTDTNKKGLSMDGIVITDQLPKEYLADLNVTVTLNGKTLTKNTDYTITDGGLFKLIFPENGGFKAPSVIGISGYMNQNIFLGKLPEDTGKTADDLGTVSINNTAYMKLSENAVVSENSTVTKQIDRKYLSKAGEQITAEKTLWTIKINQSEHAIWKCEVTDPIDKNLKLITDSVSINGEAYTIGTPKNGIVVKYSDGAGTVSSDLVISFNNPIYTMQTITFMTEIRNAGGILEQDFVSNDVTIKWWIPDGEYGIGPSDKWEIPDISISYNAAMVTKTASDIDKDGLITWTVRPSSRFVSHTQAKIIDTIQTDQTYVEGSMVLSVNGVKLNNTTISTSMNEAKLKTGESASLSWSDNTFTVDLMNDNLELKDTGTDPDSISANIVNGTILPTKRMGIIMEIMTVIHILIHQIL